MKKQSEDARIYCYECKLWEPCRCQREEPQKAPQPPQTPAALLGTFLGGLVAGWMEVRSVAELSAEEPECSFCDRAAVGWTKDKSGRRIEICGQHGKGLK